jgi:hypothetical protein
LAEWQKEIERISSELAEKDKDLRYYQDTERNYKK